MLFNQPTTEYEKPEDFGPLNKETQETNVSDWQRKTTISEGFDASQEAQWRGDGAVGVEVALWEQHQANAEAYQEQTGKELKSPQSYQYFLNMARHLEGQDTKWSELTGGEKLYGEMTQQLEQAKLDGYNVSTPLEMWARVRELAGEAESKSALSYKRSGVAGTIGHFAGAVAGSFTDADPLNVGTALWGATRRGLGFFQWAALEIGVQLGIEGINQFASVDEQRKLLGLDNSLTRQLLAVGGAGVGGAVVPVVGTVAKKTATKIQAGRLERERANNPQKALGRDMGKILDEQPGLDRNNMTAEQIKIYDRITARAVSKLDENTPQGIRSWLTDDVIGRFSDRNSDIDFGRISPSLVRELDGEILARIRNYQGTRKLDDTPSRPLSKPPEYRGVPLAEVSAAMEATARDLNFRIDVLEKKISSNNAFVESSRADTGQVGRFVDRLEAIDQPAAFRLREIEAIDKSTLSPKERKLLAAEQEKIRTSDTGKKANADRTNKEKAREHSGKTAEKRVRELELEHKKLTDARHKLWLQAARDAQKLKKEASAATRSAESRARDRTPQANEKTNGVRIGAMFRKEDMGSIMEGRSRLEKSNILDDELKNVDAIVAKMGDFPDGKLDTPVESGLPPIDRNMEIPDGDGNVTTAGKAFDEIKEADEIEKTMNFCVLP